MQGPRCEASFSTMEEPNSALEQFRREWREEVSAQSKNNKDPKHSLHGHAETSRSSVSDVPRPSRAAIRPPPPPPPPPPQKATHPAGGHNNDGYDIENA